MSRSDPVNTLDGDLTQSYTEFNIPALGHALSFTLTYDAQEAQQQVIQGATTPPMFGWGWSGGGASSSLHFYTSKWNGVSYSYVSAIEGNGSTVTFVQGSWSGSTPVCPGLVGPGGQAYVPRTVSGSTDVYCAEPDVIAQLGYMSSGDYELEVSGGKEIYTYKPSGTLQYEGNIVYPYFTEFTSASGGTGACPKAANHCTIITNLPGTSPPARSIVFELDSAGQVFQVLDPSGNPYNLSYDASGNLIGIEGPSPTGSGTVTRSFTYDTSSSYPSLVHDMLSATGPRGNTTSFA